ncbi:MAG TPA: anhydro-N-acetylmuramic acid kinase [Puia sp.]|jgi:anhydro-N-acetylmuramic acid kinase
MVYKVIGLMSGSSLDGLDIAYVHLQERVVTSAKADRQWEYEIVHAVCYPYPEQWKRRLAEAPLLSALDYQLLHVEYGRWLGTEVLRMVEEFGLHYQVQLIASHGHTVFHVPERRMTAQIGDGATLAAVTRINVVSDLRAMDLALGGQGAPIVPIGEKLLPGMGVVVPDAQLTDYKEALVMALMGVLRWREENNVLASVTGASRDSIGGAVWIGQEG